MSKTTELINEAEAHLLHTYNRFPVVFERGEGVRLYDAEGKNIWISAQGSRSTL